MQPTPRLASRLAPLCLATLAACGSVPSRTFDIAAIDTREQPVPALIVVGDQDWDAAAQKDQFVNVAKGGRRSVTIEFPRPEVEITLVPVAVARERVIVPKSSKERSESGLPAEQSRSLRLDDHPRVLFIFPPASSR